jgi:hypothetical protein
MKVFLIQRVPLPGDWFINVAQTGKIIARYMKNEWQIYLKDI